MPSYSSIQDFLLANDFVYIDGAFHRDDLCISAKDLMGKPLAYFVERFSLPVPHEEILVPLPLPLVARFPERLRTMHF